MVLTLVPGFIIVMLMLTCPAGATYIRVEVSTGDKTVVDEKSSGAAYATLTSSTRTAWGAADPSAGALKAYATGAGPYQSSSAGILVQDSFTYHGPATTLVLAMRVEGTYSAAENAKAHYYAYIGYSSGYLDAWLDGPVSGAVSTTLYGYRWTTDGETFPLQYNLTAGSAYIATSDSGSTAKLSFMTQDSEATFCPLPAGSYLLSDGGYDSRSSAVPLPPGILLFATALAGLAGARFTGKRR